MNVLFALGINLKHFVVVLVVKHPMVGVDHAAMMMITTNRGKILRHGSMDLRHGHLEVDYPDVVLVMVPWNNVPNLMRNGFIVMIVPVSSMLFSTIMLIIYRLFAGSSSNYESNQSRSGGWRTNSSTSERDLNSRRPQTKRDRTIDYLLPFHFDIFSCRNARMDGR